MSESGRSRVVGLLATIALGIGLGLAATGGGIGRREVDPSTAVDRGVAALVGAFVAASLALACTVAVRALRPTAARRLAAAPVVLVAAAAGGLLAIDRASTADAVPASGEDRTEQVFDAATSADTGTARSPASEERDEPIPINVEIGGTLVLLVALGFLALAVVFFARRTEARAVGHTGVYLTSDLDSADPDEPDDATVAAALTTTLATLDLDGSPTALIRAAYGEMLDNLAAAGLPRHRAEPPGAYISRCLGARRLPDEPIHELLTLFELARFSTDPMHTADVERARSALGRIIADLAATAP